MEYYICQLANPVRQCRTSAVYPVDDLHGNPVGLLYRESSCLDGIKHVNDQLSINGLGHVSAEYLQSSHQIVVVTGAILSPQASIIRMFLIMQRDRHVQRIYLKPPALCARFPYEPYVDPLNFFTVLRLYRYTLEPNFVTYVQPIIQAKNSSERLTMSVQFNYFEWIAKETPTRGGPLGPGHDQYATYFDYPNEQTSPFFDADHVFINNVCSANYMSLSWGNPTDPKLMSSLPYGYTDTFPGIVFSVADDIIIPSPFVTPHPTSGCYDADGCPCVVVPPRSPNASVFIQGNVHVYRLDKQSSAFIEGDQYKPHECLFTYLFAILTNTIPTSIADCSSFEITKRYGIIQYPVPSSVYAGCQVYPETIDVQYWSVSSHLCNVGTVPPYVPFWTVNAKMIADISTDGYGYILWAPYEEVVPYIKDVTSPIPPIIHVPSIDRNAYLLLEPSLAFIFRYREPSKDWSGNPVYAPCTNTPAEMFQTPITDELVAPDGTNWCPQIYGCDASGSLAEFLSSIPTDPL